TEAPGNTSGSSAAFSSSSPSPSPPQSLTLLVMQPCGGDGEAVGAMLQPQVVQPAQALGPAGDAEGDSEAGHGATGADGACSPTGGLEDLDDEDESGAQSGGGGGGCKSCTYEGCNETTTQVAKQRKPWMCKRHRNKMYKDKYKRKKSDQALGGGGGGEMSSTKHSPPKQLMWSVKDQRTGNIGDRPAKPTLLEQVLNQKRLVILGCCRTVTFSLLCYLLLARQVVAAESYRFPNIAELNSCKSITQCILEVFCSNWKK
uniref:Regulatory factor X associated protein n=1 Tax=Naja naja TaxID=35670 RepID=A0A8C6VTJ4_NAJNA